MKSFLKITLYFALSIFLTILTQIGGLVFWGSFIFYRLIVKPKITHQKFLFLRKMGIFGAFYLLTTLYIVPPIAKQFGRVPLPMFKTQHIRPVTVWTCLLNRHYVRPALKKAVESVAAKLNEKYPNTEMAYLDANMPFIDGFPLIPHLSHSDGRKLDLAFFYTDKQTGLPTNEKPAYSGYGVFVEPESGERNRIEECKSRGFWQYDYNKYFTFGANRIDFVFDEARTREMINFFTKELSIEKMFIEPHLSSRLKIKHPKIRLHGCQAVRHDDHLHIQIKR